MNGSSSRARFLAGSGAALAQFGILRSPAKAAAFQYKLGHTLSDRHPTNIRLGQMADAVRKETNGRFELRIYPNNQLGGDTSLLSQVRAGAIQFFVGTVALSTLIPATEIDAVPFAFTSNEQAFAASDGALGQYIRKEIEAKGLASFPIRWAMGFRQITTSTKSIVKPDDLAGLRLRTPASKIYLDLFSALGASPTPINLSELYTSLQTHVVDGEENPVDVIETTRLFEVQKYLSLSNHIWSANWLTGNADAWKALPPDIQDTFLRNGRKYSLLARQDSITLETSILGDLRRRGLAINPVDMRPFRARLRPQYVRWRDHFGPTGWKLLEQYAGPLA